MSKSSVQLSVTLRKHGTNAEQIIYGEKSQAFFHASKSLEGVDIPSIKNTRLYLLFFSIELQFKKILLNYGVSREDLIDSKKFGHLLINLYRKCLECGLIVDNNLIKELFQKYKKLYARDLRYYAGPQDIFSSTASDDEFTSLEAFRVVLTRVPE